MLKIKTPAKINLVLEVTAKRPDGYHEIRSVIQAIALFDELSFESYPEIKLECDIQPLLVDNLIIKAANLLKRVHGYDSGAAICLKKNIPVSAGLGGGSSDAAATLIGLNKLWKLNLDEHSLVDIAAQLGSDVPFFIRRGTALAEGRGEKITSLPGLNGGWIILMIPTQILVANKTAVLYSRLQASDYSDGSYVDKFIDSLARKNSVDLSLLYNTFDRVSTEFFPFLKSEFDSFHSAGATNVHVAGAGPALFTLVENRNEAERLINGLKINHKSAACLICQLADK